MIFKFRNCVHVAPMCKAAEPRDVRKVYDRQSLTALEIGKAAGQSSSRHNKFARGVSILHGFRVPISIQVQYCPTGTKTMKKAVIALTIALLTQPAVAQTVPTQNAAASPVPLRTKLSRAEMIVRLDSAIRRLLKDGDVPGL